MNKSQKKRSKIIAVSSEHTKPSKEAIKKMKAEFKYWEDASLKGLGKWI